ncbi:MAG: hypothetical protein J07HB67_01493 [halophilic archaeon J07HB67]|nr:MAG: hypothetical protein J07HB67_01493 [halophilic archaeon J07HB67]
MSKITFRADDELVEQLEAHDASKSEVLRAALRAYLDGPEREQAQTATESELASLFDRVLERRLREFLGGPQGAVETRRDGRRRSPTEGGRSVVVEITPDLLRQRLDGRDRHDTTGRTDDDRPASDTDERGSSAADGGGTRRATHGGHRCRVGHRRQSAVYTVWNDVVRRPRLLSELW